MNSENLLKQLGHIDIEPREADTECITEEQLRAYRSGTLSETEGALVETHLTECALCSDMLICLDEALPSLSWSARRRIQKEISPASSMWSWAAVTKLATGLAAVALVVLAIRLPLHEGAPLGPYGLDLAGYAMESRGANKPGLNASFVFEPENDIVLKAFPRRGQPSDEMPVVVAYLLEPDGVFQPFQPEPEITLDPETGVIELRIRAGELLGERFGPHMVRVLLLPVGCDAPESLSRDTIEFEGGRLLNAAFEYRAPR